LILRWFYWRDVEDAVPYGETIKTAIENIPKYYAAVTVDKYAIMPNHIHMIVVLHEIESGRA